MLKQCKLCVIRDPVGRILVDLEFIITCECFLHCFCLGGSYLLKIKLGYNNSHCINIHHVLVIVLLIVNHFTTVQKHVLASLKMVKSVVFMTTYLKFSPIS